MHIVYNSFNGRFSDNPRAIYEALQDRPGFRHTWVRDPAHSSAFPDGVETVAVGSVAEREALEACDLVVAGTHTEIDWDKPQGTRYLQTWHGTPLKRIHYDVLLVPPGRLEYLDEDVARWDVLLSPNTESTPRLRKAFGYDGEVWESGYPRNDLLLSPQADLVRAEARAELGIEDDEVAVLYAPTWRDDEHYARASEMRLDLPAFAATLNASGRKHVVLPRLHNMVSDLSRPPLGPHVVDVSFYRDVRELHLAADILVTDYSSLMFDFALTGKPMVFYTYDLERYRDEIRGFYFDLVPQAPGPVVVTEAELTEAILAQDGSEHDRYAEFRATYGHLEDGHATERVLERLGLL
jgi:CDP-glycerol glycerophosphotransferase